MSSNKSFSTETSHRYARALFEVANENSELVIIEENVKDLLNIYDQDNKKIMNDDSAYEAANGIAQVATPSHSLHMTTFDSS